MSASLWCVWLVHPTERPRCVASRLPGKWRADQIAASLDRHPRRGLWLVAVRKYGDALQPYGPDSDYDAYEGDRTEGAEVVPASITITLTASEAAFLAGFLGETRAIDGSPITRLWHALQEHANADSDDWASGRAAMQEHVLRAGRWAHGAEIRKPRR